MTNYTAKCLLLSDCGFLHKTSIDPFSVKFQMYNNNNSDIQSLSRAPNMIFFLPWYMYITHTYFTGFKMHYLALVYGWKVMQISFHFKCNVYSTPHSITFSDRETCVYMYIALLCCRESQKSSKTYIYQTFKHMVTKEKK